MTREGDVIGPAAGAATSAGERLFARFAFAPNDLGYCGPSQSAALFELGATGSTEADVAAIARGFSGAWPYLALLAEVSGIGDPLDERIVRAYWTGSPLLDRIDRPGFAARLLEFIGSRAGLYWRHLTPDLLPEVTATHGFHVFGIYPWSRLLAAPDRPLSVLDNCRIRWGQVVAADGAHVVVRSRRLTWDGCQLGLAAPAEERVRFAIDGRGFVVAPVPGEWLALHWDWVCDRLSPVARGELQRRTAGQLRATNLRLARERKGAA